MIPESNPAFQAAWEAYIERPNRQPSTIEGFTAGYEARDAEVERLRSVIWSLIPSHRSNRDFCWCELSRDVSRNGHSASCIMTRAALQPEQTNA